MNNSPIWKFFCPSCALRYNGYFLGTFVMYILRLVGPDLVQPPHFPIPPYEVTSHATLSRSSHCLVVVLLTWSSLLPPRNTSRSTSKVLYDLSWLILTTQWLVLTNLMTGTTQPMASWLHPMSNYRVTLESQALLMPIHARLRRMEVGKVIGE